jgi:hypothetical protein
MRVWVLLGLCGCSYLMVEPVPRPLPPAGEVRCTSSDAMPVLDSVLAVGGGIAGGYVGGMLAADSLDQATPNRAAVLYAGPSIALGALAGALLGALVPGLSAHTGFQRVSNCRAAQAR